MAVRSSLFAFAVLILTASPLVAGPPDGPAKRTSVDRRRPAASDLSGEWRMFLPAGWERTVRLERLGENRYYFHPPFVMKGTYEVRGREMAFVSEDRIAGDADLRPEEETPPAKSTDGEFVWSVRSPYLMTLTSGAAGYRDAVLFRSNGREIRAGEAPEDAAAPETERSSRADGAPFSPLAIDLPATDLAVKLFSGEKGTRHPDGELAFPVTITNGSQQPIQLKLPSEPGPESSVAAYVRPANRAQAEKETPPYVAMHVYRAGDGAERPEVTILPGESFEFDAMLSRFRADEPQRRLEPQRTYEIRLSMTFKAEGTLQYLAGPRGNVVTFEPLRIR
ncbi:MAG TPA: hypothetical protein VGN57_06875 [Pirellulaceae bacterium]|jgi:hypothetical protein|nr:hypothetical protein [Pirellulaceae bacterium]